MKKRKIIGAAAAIIMLPSAAFANLSHTVKKGDTYYLIAQRYGVSLSSLLKANGATEKSILYIGDKITVPTDDTYYTAKKGDTYFLIAQRYGVSLSSLLKANGATESSVLYIGDTVRIPSAAASADTTKPYVTYTSYTVKSSDTLWNIAIKFGIPFDELLKTNSLNESSKIYSGMKLTIPVHHVPVKSTPSAKYGELLDWFTEAQYVVPINADFKVTDLATGKSFNARRTVGSGHADCETLTAADTAAMKAVWGGTLSWNKRSVIIEINGRKIAASAAAAMHAGNEWAPGGAWTDWRSGNYGAGINYDYVKGNECSGHFDLYFYNSIGHSSGTTNSAHQANVLKSAGK